MSDRIGTEVKTLGGNDPWAQGQVFKTVEQLQEKIANAPAPTLRERLAQRSSLIRGLGAPNYADMAMNEMAQLDATIASQAEEIERLREEISFIGLLTDISRLTADNERLRELVTKAYAEGFGDAWAIAEDNLNQVAEYGTCWEMSHAFAALQPKEDAA